MNGRVCGDDSLMKNVIVHFYENLLHDDQPQRPLLDGISYDTISMEDTFDLVRDFSEEEGRNAINDLGKEKAPGRGLILLSFNIVGMLSRGT